MALASASVLKRVKFLFLGCFWESSLKTPAQADAYAHARVSHGPNDRKRKTVTSYKLYTGSISIMKGLFSAHHLLMNLFS
ncbi:hypothetical protein FHS90_000311 [Rufibacter quisquiliarum]|uniref:Uncharacterized protein n=1 Tax=Rufibacter quisquiliarum TaxID=1549639 RepID=A0A839G848_9BACT|nr:hypothetical protein [Rufibacter quisquiliarum]